MAFDRVFCSASWNVSQHVGKLIFRFDLLQMILIISRDVSIKFLSLSFQPRSQRDLMSAWCCLWRVLLRTCFALTSPSLSLQWQSRSRQWCQRNLLETLRWTEATMTVSAGARPTRGCCWAPTSTVTSSLTSWEDSYLRNSAVGSWYSAECSSQRSWLACRLLQRATILFLCLPQDSCSAFWGWVESLRFLLIEA